MRVVVAVPRIVPVALAATGIFVAASESEPMFRGLLDGVKVAATRYELGALASHVATDLAAGFSVPEPGDDRAFASYVRREGHTLVPRDPSVDLWNTPYAWERGDAPGTARIRSLGPDRVRGACADADRAGPDAPTDGVDDVCAGVRMDR